MRLVVIVLAVGCDAGTPPPRSPEPLSSRALTPRTAPIADAAVTAADAWEAPGDAISEAQRLDVRQSVRDAPPWIGRSHYAAGIPLKRYPPLTTYFLRVDGDQALVTVETRERQDDGSWGTPAQREWPLVVVDQKKALELRGMNGEHDVPIQACKRTKLAVAAASAVRVPHPMHTECGNEGVWSPSKTKHVDALLCTTDSDGAHQIGLAAPPGIEWLFVNDDCVMQGGGWRALPGDGSVAPPRKK